MLVALRHRAWLEALRGVVGEFRGIVWMCSGCVGWLVPVLLEFGRLLPTCAFSLHNLLGKNAGAI